MVTLCTKNRDYDPKRIMIVFPVFQICIMDVFPVQKILMDGFPIFVFGRFSEIMFFSNFPKIYGRFSASPNQ